MSTPHPRPPDERQVEIALGPARLVTILVSAIMLNVVMLAGTYAYWSRTDGSWKTTILLGRHLNLADENVLAAWYSSMLLLAVATAAGVAFLADRQEIRTRTERTVVFGWVVLALAFAGLSLDEAGSLHERIGAMPQLQFLQDQAKGWVSVFILPIAAVGTFFLAFAWVRLRRTPAALVLMVLGVIAFLSIPFQEYVQMAMKEVSVAATGEFERPVSHVLLEEGAEIFGSTFFLAAFLLAASRTITRTTARDGRKGDGVLKLAVRPGMLTGAVAAVVISLFCGALIVEFLVLPITPNNVGWGVPLNWFAGSLAMITGLLAIARAVRISRSNGVRSGTPRLLTALGIYGILISLDHGSGHYVTETLGNASVARGLVIDAGLLLASALLALGLYRGEFPNAWVRVSFVTGALVTGTAAAWSAPFGATLLSFGGFAMLLFSVVAHDFEEIPVPAAAGLVYRRLGGWQAVRSGPVR